MREMRRDGFADDEPFELWDQNAFDDGTAERRKKDVRTTSSEPTVVL